MNQPSSNIFEGFKSIGCITGPLPFIVRHANNPKDTRVITIVGRTFHTYTLNGILVEVSVPHEYPIKVIIADAKHVYSSSGRSILIWGRGSKKLIQRLDRGHQADVHLMIKFGNSKLASVDEDNNLFIWNIKEDKEILNIINFDEDLFEITSLCHPFDYQDKILLASKQGSLQLWDVVQEECVHKFDGWNSPITCLLQSPVVDVIGIGLDDGHIQIYNIKHDKTLMRMLQDYGPVTSISFRLDGLPYLVSASNVGHLSVWNLERKCIATQIRSAHTGPISCCRFVRNESILVTTGHDNSLKIWSLDMSDGGGNLLSQRSGHIGPPTFIRFYDSFHILSAGCDSTLKCFHLLSERLSKNLGLARKRRDEKLPPIIRFSAERVREKQWDNISACHKDSSLVTTWNYDKCKLGQHVIEQPTFNNHEVFATMTCISPCGNFMVIGFNNGFIFKYNIQSGIFRLTFECPGLAEHKAHSEPISGLCVDSLSLNMISASTDGFLKIWNFKNASLNRKLNIDTPIKSLEIHAQSNLLAVALLNHDIKVIELDTYSFVRDFKGLSNILDMTFSPDARWLIASYEDKSIRTWDLLLGKLIDAFALSSQCVSLTFSETGEFLATALSNFSGIVIWSNITVYVPTPLNIVDIEANVPILDIPHFCCDEKADDDEDEAEDNTLVGLGEQVTYEYISPQQLHKEMIELSGLPASRWKNLLRIDEIRREQKIEQEKKKDKQPVVPFFLPVADGLKPKLAFQHQEDRFSTPFVKSLSNCCQSSDYLPFIDYLKQLGPSQTDAEIRCLAVDTCRTNQPLLNFLDAIQQLLEKNLDFELASSWLALSVKIHADDIEADQELIEKCKVLNRLMDEKWSKIKFKFAKAFSVMNYLRFSAM